MILTPTTFVIGAGASCPYGLPTGTQLRDHARQLNPDAAVYSLLLFGNSITAMQLNNFLDDLRQHTAPSIDSYLETRLTNRDTMRIGKRVIAALMGDLVSKVRDKTTCEQDDWLGYVFERMREGAPTPEKFVEMNRVRFVTFNFDTLIESRFERFMYSTFGQTPSNLPPVIHVHGELPPVPENPWRLDELGRFNPSWVSWLSQAASKINVVLDDIDEAADATLRILLR